MLAFLDCYAPINVDAFVECSTYTGDIQVVPSCHKGLSLSVLIQSYIITDYFCNPQKASVGMYSRYDYLLFVYVLILPSLLHSSILFNCFLYLFLFFFIILSAIYQCHLITTSVQCNYKQKLNGRYQNSPLINLRSYAYNIVLYRRPMRLCLGRKQNRVLSFIVGNS